MRRSFVIGLVLCAGAALLGGHGLSQASQDEGAAEMPRQEFLVLLTPARATFPEDATREEMEVVGAHFRRLQRGVRAGDVILAGRTQDDEPLGLVIIEAADMGTAEEYAAADPAVAAGIFNAEVRAYRTALLRGRDG